MNRYNRHIILPEIGTEGQEKISEARVLVIGAGGLGCPVLMYLAAAGVGTLGIIDFDSVEESNLQRQVLFGHSTLGLNKATAAKTRLTDLNRTITVNSYPFRLTAANVIELFNQYDIVVDGSDNFETRYLVNDASVYTNTPLVYGAIYKFEGQVSVFNLKKGPSYRCLFPSPPKSGSIPNCNEIGVLGVLPGIVGSMQANEVLKIILDHETILSGKLMCYDSRSAQTYTINIPRIEECIKKILQEGIDPNNPDYHEPICQTLIPEISFEKAIDIPNVIFIDIRETYEDPSLELPRLKQIPLHQIQNEIDAFNSSEPKIIFCQNGNRSLTAVEFLKSRGVDNCFSLKGGIKAITNLNAYIK